MGSVALGQRAMSPCRSSNSCSCCLSPTFGQIQWVSHRSRRASSHSRPSLCIRYAQTTAVERLQPAAQCTKTPPAALDHIRRSAKVKASVGLMQVLGGLTDEAFKYAHTTAEERLRPAMECTSTSPAGKQSSSHQRLSQWTWEIP